MSTVPTVTLNNGVAMPLLGFGVFQVTDLNECERSVLDAIETGYRLLDTAASYGNEEAVGNAIRFILHNDIAPAVNQIETHPFHQQIETQTFLREHNVQIESWGPFAEGKNNIFHNDVLLSIPEKHSKSVAQVILRWLTQRSVVAIPKSVR